MDAKILSAPVHPIPELSGVGLAIVEHAPMPMALVEGPSHIVRQMNFAFCRLMADRTLPPIGKSFGDLPEYRSWLPVLDRVYLTGKAESFTEEQLFERPAIFWTYTLWPIVSDGHPGGVMIQVAEATKQQKQAVAINEALVLGSVHQHELTEIAETLNTKLKAEISERKLIETALRESEDALRTSREEIAQHAKILENLVAVRTAELRATNQNLEAFVNSIAHDLRAPLRSMQGFAALLSEDTETVLSESGRDFVQRIDHSAQFMDALLKDLLAFSHISQHPVKLAVVNLETVVGSVLSRLQNEIRDTNACVECSGPWPEVLADEPVLNQVLFNLTSNALKFIRPDVLPLLRLRAEEGEACNRVWVEDNGVGIEPEFHEQIFRLFIRLNRGKYPGTGAGLAMVKKGVERMGGRMGVESTPGQGSRFWIELAKAGAAEADRPDAALRS